MTVFASGDSSKISSWSNVPFFFTETLLAKGIKVNRVDISPSPRLEKLIYQGFYRIFKRLYKGLEYDYFHSYINFLDVQNRIKKAIGYYKNSDVDIFLPFNFSSLGLTTIAVSQTTYPISSSLHMVATVVKPVLRILAGNPLYGHLHGFF